MLLTHFRVFLQERNRTAGRRNGLTVKENMSKCGLGDKRENHAERDASLSRPILALHIIAQSICTEAKMC